MSMAAISHGIWPIRNRRGLHMRTLALAWLGQQALQLIMDGLLCVLLLMVGC